MQTLKEVAVGKTVSVVKLHGEGAVKRRIMDMGITKAGRWEKLFRGLISCCINDKCYLCDILIIGHRMELKYHTL